MAFRQSLVLMRDEERIGSRRLRARLGTTKKEGSRGSIIHICVSIPFWMRRFEQVFRNWTSCCWKRKTETPVVKGRLQHHRSQVKGLTCPCGRESFFQDGREGRKFGWWSKENKELGGNLWEFSSDVLNFPREVGGEVIFESEGAGEEIDLEENEGSEEGCGGEFRDREYSAGDEKGCSQALSPATKVHLLCLPCPNPLWL